MKNAVRGFLKKKISPNTMPKNESEIHVKRRRYLHNIRLLIIAQETKQINKFYITKLEVT